MQLYQMSLLEIVQGAGNCFARGRDALADPFVRKWQPEPSSTSCLLVARAPLQDFEIVQGLW